MELKIRDKVLFKTEKDVINNIHKIGKRYQKTIAWLQGIQSQAPTKEAEILKNILVSTLGYTKYIKSGAFKDIQLLALGVRSVLENLSRARFIMKDDENLDRWLSEVITDQKTVIKGFLSLGDASSDSIKALEIELTRLDRLCEKYNFPVVKQPQQVKTMTEAVGLVEDYDSIYKLTSKLIHPSSLYINSRSTLDNKEYHNILVICGQLYLISMLNEICMKLNAPSAIADMT
ncbi:TPA: hypothetical protein RVR74_001294 [Aeromonas salmonicida]|nr:hypothetical protein [Aeromonas salmonicida]